MAVTTKSFTQIITDAVTAVQGAARALIDFSIGSVLLAVMESAAGIALWLQGIALQIAALTRFSTSSGPDADSWGADFNFPRLPAQAASGPVTFARFTPTAQARVTAATSSGTDSNGNTIWTGGAIVQTADGSEQFQVIPDANQTAYNATLNAYVLPANTASITATVKATTAGSAGNVSAGLINTIASAIIGVDTVTNAAGFTDGADQELDAAYRARFPNYIASISKGTVLAVETATTDVQQGITLTLTENQAYNGAADDGFFYEVVDDGSGAPPSPLLSAIANAVEAVRPITTTYAIFAPVVVPANVAMTVTAAAGFTHTAVAAAVQSALVAFLNSLTLGVDLPYTKLAQIAYGASPGVANVTGITLNSGTSDLIATNQQVIKAGTITIS